MMCFILDMIRRGNLRTRSIKLLVLDEADEMLAKGSAILLLISMCYICI